jgi:hypothetical protein
MKLLLMVAQEEDWKGKPFVENRLLKSARKGLTSLAPVQADVLLLRNSGNLRGTAKRLASPTG